MLEKKMATVTHKEKWVEIVFDDEKKFSEFCAACSKEIPEFRLKCKNKNPFSTQFPSEDFNLVLPILNDYLNMSCEKLEIMAWDENNCLIKNSFFKTIFTLGGDGQVSSAERTVYGNIDDKKLWRFKSSHPFQEYMGFAAYKALGIEVPNFGIGIADERAYCNGAAVFIQEYLQDASNFGDQIHALEALGYDKTIPVIVAIALLGDSDGVGESGDNILLKKEANTIIKIDCGKTFECLITGIQWIIEEEEFNTWNSLFDDFVSKHRKNIDFITAVNTYLGNLDVNDIYTKIIAAYQKIKCLKFLFPNKKYSQQLFKEFDKDFAILADKVVGNIKALSASVSKVAKKLKIDTITLDNEENIDDEAREQQTIVDEQRDSQKIPYTFSFKDDGKYNIESISVMGTFNKWAHDPDYDMEKNADNIWKLTISLEPGHYEFKYYINKIWWVPDPNCPKTQDKYQNSVLNVMEPSNITKHTAGKFGYVATFFRKAEIVPHGNDEISFKFKKTDLEQLGRDIEECRVQ